MNKFKYYIHSISHWRLAQKFARASKRAIHNTMAGIGVEANETRQMALLFYRMLAQKLDLQNREHPPTPAEVKEAMEQLKDIGRLSVFTTISIIPGGAFSLIGLELLARKFGVKNFTFVPSAFRRKIKDEGIVLSEESKKKK